MIRGTVVGFSLLACLAGAQHVRSVYNRDTHAEFDLKKVESEALVLGPIVRQKTVFTYANPFKTPTEASFWFGLDEGGVLGDFGYWYRDEYVPGVLMDKNRAWFIYTAITSRNEDPGIMTQTDASDYHAQVFPLAVGYDFRLALTGVGFLSNDDGKMEVPTVTAEDKEYPQKVRSADAAAITPDPNDAAKTIVDYPQNPHLDLKVYAQKHRGYTYVAGMIRTDKPDANVTVSGIHHVYWTRPDGSSDGSVKFFVGRRKGAGMVRVHSDQAAMSCGHYIKANERGDDAAKLWAHQKLTQDNDLSRTEILKLSLAYHIPSSQTALLAVPQEEMRVYKEKAAEYKREQERQARMRRNWQSQRNESWNRSSGGDPEIRIYAPTAKRVYAVLPDGTKFDLVMANDGYWGGNYEIPADAPQGDYQIKIYALDEDGMHEIDPVTYHVDRTPPNGKLTNENGFYVLNADKTLARAVAVFGDGTEENMVRTSPTQFKLPIDSRRLVKIVMFDQSHNIGEVAWSSLS